MANLLTTQPPGDFSAYMSTTGLITSFLVLVKKEVNIKMFVYNNQHVHIKHWGEGS